MKRAALAVFLAGAACDGGGLHPNFANAWVLALAVDVPGLDPTNYAATASITISGSTGAAEDVCPTGGGIWSLTGHDRSASWDGHNVPCNSFFIPEKSCSLTLTYGSGSLTLTGMGNSQDSVLRGTGTATARGCTPGEVTLPLTFEGVPVPS
jgi:hypothetical protein